mmetsp:Transcript_3156/g.10540  ORF Transcript_3156/g.10540 Transcript_3156/m.10540 type:complete len:215 (-) Transcript_3156:94-738(-)
MRRVRRAGVELRRRAMEQPVGLQRPVRGGEEHRRGPRVEWVRPTAREPRVDEGTLEVVRHEEAEHRHARVEAAARTEVANGRNQRHEEGGLLHGPPRDVHGQPDAQCEHALVELARRRRAPAGHKHEQLESAKQKDARTDRRDDAGCVRRAEDGHDGEQVVAEGRIARDEDEGCAEHRGNNACTPEGCSAKCQAEVRSVQRRSRRCARRNHKWA